MNGNINELKKLIEYYENNKNTIHSNWNETETRIELINPLFECLGWDVRNNQNLADPFKEVKHEASLKIGEHMKAPDYSFSYGKRLFFLEAKKPSVDIKNDINPSYQLRRYGWTAKLPISILTNFEDLAIYDCRIKPSHNDSAGIARIKYYTYAEYIDKWDDIYNLISKDAILHGSLNDFENKQLKGTDSIDDDFLNSIENWRKLLALNIASRNPELSEKDLNFAVQMIIDRIIFLRICEDRGIQDYEELKIAASQDNCYKWLIKIFKDADKKYNSGLFHFEVEKDRAETPDNITANLKIDDKILKDIIKDLYYPDCPYALSVISSDVLGNVYERFLGNVIRLTDGHHAKVEEKPEVRKAGGVYYTPRYIVEYIVKNTVGEIIKDKKLNRVSDIKILDPACGSGSFLIEAYQYLLDWHLNYYLNNDPDKWKKGKEPKIFKSKTGLNLTLSERKKILINNIFGVDIDKNAVEVTKLSLLLKVLEYEGLEVQQKSLFNERVLPDLYNNIKCGNSLIGSDYYKEKDLSLFGNEEMQKINTFDWDKAFPEIFKSGRFDCVIGNPPWVSLNGKFGNDILSKGELEYLLKKYKANSYMPNLYEYFVWKGLNLFKKDGLFSLIIPDRLGFNEQFIPLRKHILENYAIINLQYKAKFPNIIADTLIFIIQNNNQNNNIIVGEYGKTPQNKPVSEYKNNEKYVFSYETDNQTNKVLKKIDSLINKKITSELFDTTSGFGGDSKQITENRENAKQIKILRGRNVEKYYLNGNYYFNFIKENITGRTTDKEKLGANEKILLRKTGYPLHATYDNSGIFPEQSLYFFFNKKQKESYLFYLSIINSKIFQYYYWNKLVTNRDSTPQLKKVDLDIFPFPVIDFNNQPEKQTHDRLVSLVDSMLETQKEFHNAKSDNDKKIFKQKIDIIDSQIDSLVYELYGLNEDDIKVIEAGL